MKQTLKTALCQLIYYSGILSLYLWYWRRSGKPFPCVIINYHSFVRDPDVSLDPHPTVTQEILRFKKQVAFLKKYFHLITLDELSRAISEGTVYHQPTAAITVDDGYKDNFQLLFPVLKENNIKATIFLNSGLINTDKRLWFRDLELHIKRSEKMSVRFNGRDYPLADKKHKREAYLKIVSFLKNIPTVERNNRLEGLYQKLGARTGSERDMMTWQEVKEMAAWGVCFGAHTMTHPIVTQVPVDEAKDEIRLSKDTIEETLGIAVRHFAFPNGRPQDFNDELREYCREIGFETVASCEYGANASDADRMNLKRIGSEEPLGLYAVNVVRAMHVV
ncbi:MAG: polysaccharide deacetylase family protein [Candidatus Omnitrophica bacterium]|nr:polysaccharide deacetylase family protein [Candidatus Omnitrophota bacterium]